MGSRSAEEQRWLDDYIERLRADWSNVGLAVAVVHDREIVYARGFGLRQADRSARVDADTLFQIGSTTKAFTTAALATLVHEGRIRWDDTVVSWLPEFRVQDPALTGELTIRDTVIHCSGIGDHSYYPFVAIVNADEATMPLHDIAAEAPFRDSYLYNNLLYAVAGKVIEAASATPWGDFIQRRLLTPLRMIRSTVTPYNVWNARHVAPTFFGDAPAGRATIEDALDTNVAMPHGWDELGAVAVLPWRSYDNAAAAGAIVSSAADMANWLLLNLNDGLFEGQQVLGRDTLRDLHTTQNPRIDFNQFPFEEAVESYAFGWRRATYRGAAYLAHGGGIIGFPAYVAILPERQMGVVVLSNGSQAARERLGADKLSLHKAIVFAVFDRLLGGAQRDWHSEFLRRARSAEHAAERREALLREARHKDAAPSLPLHRYVGEYVDAARPAIRVTVTMHADTLKLSFAGDGAYSGTLQHWHFDQFRLHSRVGVADVLDPVFVTFTVDPRGAVASMTVFELTLRRITAAHSHG